MIGQDFSEIVVRKNIWKLQIDVLSVLSVQKLCVCLYSVFTKVVWYIIFEFMFVYAYIQNKLGKLSGVLDETPPPHHPHVVSYVIISCPLPLNPIAMNSIFSTSFGLILMIALTLKKFSHELRYDDKSFLVLLVKAKTWVEFMKLFAFLLHQLYIECILCNVQR